MAKKQMTWVWSAVALVVALAIVSLMWKKSGLGAPTCPGSQVHCPGVGCVSGQDKCFPGAKGGPTKVFSKETFTEWPGAGVRAIPPIYEAAKETFVSKKCPGGTRSDGPCLMEF